MITYKKNTFPNKQTNKQTNTHTHKLTNIHSNTHTQTYTHTHSLTHSLIDSENIWRKITADFQGKPKFEIEREREVETYTIHPGRQKHTYTKVHSHIHRYI